MNIMIVVYCLRGGGAERVSSYLASTLADRGHAVCVVTELAPETDQYVLAPAVGREVVGLGSGGGRIAKASRSVRKALALRRVIRRHTPDVVVSFMTRSNNLTLLATIGFGQRVVICERNDPRHNRERLVLGTRYVEGWRRGATIWRDLGAKMRQPIIENVRLAL